MFSKKNLGILFVSKISGIKNNSKYSRGLLESSKSTFMPGLPVNGKHGHSAPDFVYMPCCMLLLSLTFSSSSELTLRSPHDKIFTFISLSLSEISLYQFSCNSSYNTASSLACIFLLGPAIMFTCKNSNPGQLSSNQHLPVTLWSNQKIQQAQCTNLHCWLSLYLQRCSWKCVACTDAIPTTLQSSAWCVKTSYPLTG
jgi:hypothetical protein